MISVTIHALPLESSYVEDWKTGIYCFFYKIRNTPSSSGNEHLGQTCQGLPSLPRKPL